MGKELKQIKMLMSELFDGRFIPKLSDEKISRIKNQPNVYFFPHSEDGNLVALTTLYVVELLSRKLGVIEEVVTLKKYRNKGIGSTLVRDAVSMAKFLGCTCVELNVREDKPEVQKFYEHLGFHDRKNKAMRLWINKI